MADPEDTINRNVTKNAREKKKVIALAEEPKQIWKPRCIRADRRGATGQKG